MIFKAKKYLIGIDGGGTKTIATLTDLNGKILKKIQTGSTNPNKIGLEKAIFNLRELLSRVSKDFPQEKIALAYLGLAGGLERDREKRAQIKKILEKEFSFPILVEGDQKIAFRSGTDEKEGIVIIGGTGSIVMGWRGKKEAISGGWDWLLGDQGSAFWVGKKALEEAIKSFDGRVKKSSKLESLIFKKWKIKTGKDLYQRFYDANFVEKVASVSKIVDLAANQGDKVAKGILKEAGKELAQMAIAVIEKLKFKKEFPIVLIGGMFKSKIVFAEVKKEIKKFVPKVQFIRPKKEPVVGAIKLALENLKSNL